MTRGVWCISRACSAGYSHPPARMRTEPAADTRCFTSSAGRHTGMAMTISQTKPNTKTVCGGGSVPSDGLVRCCRMSRLDPVMRPGGSHQSSTKVTARVGRVGNRRSNSVTISQEFIILFLNILFLCLARFFVFETENINYEKKITKILRNSYADSKWCINTEYRCGGFATRYVITGSHDGTRRRQVTSLSICHSHASTSPYPPRWGPARLRVCNATASTQQTPGHTHQLPVASALAEGTKHTPRPSSCALSVRFDTQQTTSLATPASSGRGRAQGDTCTQTFDWIPPHKRVGRDTVGFGAVRMHECGTAAHGVCTYIAFRHGCHNGCVPGRYRPPPCRAVDLT